jgi:CubicO group peptidase (beta-lactamase class C family)
MGSAFSTGGLDRLEAALAAHVETGQMPGLVALVALHGETRTIALGTIAFDDPAPVGTSTLVRIASLTKPIAATAAMLLVEDRLISLDEPVDRLLPELSGRQAAPAQRRHFRHPTAAVREIGSSHDERPPRPGPTRRCQIVPGRERLGVLHGRSPRRPGHAAHTRLLVDFWSAARDALI